MYLQNIPIIDISCLTDCHEYYERGEGIDGIYTIRLDDVTVVNVKCLFSGGKRSTEIKLSISSILIRIGRSTNMDSPETRALSFG